MKHPGGTMLASTMAWVDVVQVTQTSLARTASPAEPEVFAATAKFFPAQSTNVRRLISSMSNAISSLIGKMARIAST
jgi:hypothetical protein